MGKEFAAKYPTLAHYLAEPGSDPDVERLLEGFAFLTGRIRQKLDDELQELTQTLIGLLYPHYLRPIPSMAILEFEPQRTLRSPYLIPRVETEVDSIPLIGNTRCRFRTCYDVELLPISVEEATLMGQQLKLRFKLLNGVQFESLKISKLRLNLHGDPITQYHLYFLLCNKVQRVILRPVDQSEKELVLEQRNVKPVGFDEDESLLPYPANSFVGYRLLQEYFSFPEKFMFIDITGIEGGSELGIKEDLEIIFHFSQKPSEPLRVTRDNFHVNCTPIINLFPRYADPIRVDHSRTEYKVRPEGPNSHNYEVYSVDEVFGTIQGTSTRRIYEPFFSFTHSSPSRDSVYYQTRIQSSIVDGNSTETYISFVNADRTVAVPPTETVSIQLTCLNRQITEQLKLGDIRVPTNSSPEVAKFKNITNVTPTIYPPLDGRLYWKLISHLSLSRRSIADRDALKGVLNLYNYPSRSDRRLAVENERRIEGIVNVQSSKKEIIHNGAIIRGTEVLIDISEEHFATDGDIFLFASVIDEFLSLYASINSFTQLTVRGVTRKEAYSWQPKIGKQTLI